MKNRPLPLGYIFLTIATASLFLSLTFTGDDKTANKNESGSDYLSMVRTNQVTGKISPADFQKAIQQLDQQKGIRAGHAFDFEWDLLGPNNLGGKTRAIIIDNRDASGMTMYAGSVMGGLFKSDNGGGKWYKIAEENGNMNITCISQNGNGDIFIGTG
ncbi:MAG: hypothetical protein HGA23_00005, partial [Bacteroidales bacterium]|nr:hypothetical protein [Bacteroidales bacterium]